MIQYISETKLRGDWNGKHKIEDFCEDVKSDNDTGIYVSAPFTSAAAFSPRTLNRQENSFGQLDISSVNVPLNQPRIFLPIQTCCELDSRGNFVSVLVTRWQNVKCRKNVRYGQPKVRFCKVTSRANSTMKNGKYCLVRCTGYPHLLPKPKTIAEGSSTLDADSFVFANRPGLNLSGST